MNRVKNRYWIGILLITIGFGIFLDELNVIHFWRFFANWWPLIFVFIGISQLTSKETSKTSGIIFIIIGLFILSNRLFGFDLFSFILPVLLILIGMSFIINRSKTPTVSSDSIDTTAIFTGAKIRSESNDFKGGSVTAIFGGAEVDLRHVTVSPDGAIVHVTALFGGVEIFVPTNVRLEMNGTPIFGAWEDKTRVPAEKDATLPLLQIKCTALFGGIEVKD